LKIGSRVAIDANLLVLLVVGGVSKAHVERHKRLRAYTAEDFDLLTEILDTADAVFTTPNALTEASNLIFQGVSEPLRSQNRQALKYFVEQSEERFLPSRIAVSHQHFDWLGLADCVWLDVIKADGSIVLLTADHDLHVMAQSIGCRAVNFNHLREDRGCL
jgi:hypothetical protein